MPSIRKMTARDAAFQRFETMKRNREKRAKQKVFFVEGVHPIEQAVRFGWEFEALGYPAGVRLSGWANDMRAKAKADVEYQIAPELMDELSEREESCEIIALVRQRADGLAGLPHLADRRRLPLLRLPRRKRRPHHPGYRDAGLV